MNTRRFDIGDTITFTHHDVTRHGKIVGAEHVDDWRRGRGWHFVVQTPDYEIIDVHASQIGSVVGEVAHFA